MAAIAIRKAELEASLERAQAALIARYAPGTGRRFIRWSGGETQVLELGDGPPLLLVHGELADATNWLPIFPALAREHRVLAPDRPGHGLASPMDYVGVDLLDHATTFLREIMAALGIERAPMVANSMGGRWALEFALRERPHVERLVLVGAPAGTRRSVPVDLAMVVWPIAGRVLRWLMGRSSPADARRFYRRTISHHTERVDDLAYEEAAIAQRRNIRSYLSLIDAFLTPAGTRSAFMIDERWPGWRRLAVPLTFIWGELDAFDRPDFADRVVPLLPAGGTVVRIADAGHLPWWDDPLSVARAIAAALDTGPLRPVDQTPGAPVGSASGAAGTIGLR